MSGPTPSGTLSGTAALRDALVAELLQARLVCVLATLEPDGSVHAVPMWYAGADDVVLLATGSRSRKLANLGRDPRATLVVHDSRPGFEVCGVSMRGVVEIVRGAEALPLVERVHRRYVTEAGEQLPAPAAFLASDDVALRFRPEHAVTWDERGSTAAAELGNARAALPLEPTSPRVPQ